MFRMMPCNPSDDMPAREQRCCAASPCCAVGAAAAKAGATLPAIRTADRALCNRCSKGGRLFTAR